jgi:hypothetical protein
MTILTRTARGALALTALIALAACEHGDPVSQGGGPLGRATLVSSSPSSATLPSGTATSFTHFGGFSTDIPDAFSRMPSTANQARRTQAFATFTGCCTVFEWYQNGARNASPELLDPRLPAIQSTTAVIDDPEGGYVDLYVPDPAAGFYPGADYWEMYTPGFSGLTAGTQYQVVFVHYRLKVNGELDHVERMLTGAVTEPDELVKVSGEAAEANTDWSDAAPEGCADYVSGANPFVIATQEADADGFVSFDKCWKANNGLWTLESFDVSSRSMVGRNDNTAYDLPNYNYLEVWEGTYGAAAGPVLRMQIAQDLDLNGKPIANAFAPFPAPATPFVATGDPPIPDQEAEFPLSADVLATLTGAIGVPDSVSVTATNVARLDQGVYKVWYLNPTTGAAKPAIGKYTRTLDGVVQADSAVGTSTFQGGPGTITFTSGPYLTDAGTYDDSLRFVVVTKEADAAAATPSGSQPLWQNIFKIPPGSAGGSLFFGDFNSGTSRFRFIPQGSLSGAVLGDTVPVTVTDTVEGQVVQVRVLEFQGSMLDVTMTGLTRPPEGYRYQAYLFTSRDESTTPVTDSALVNIGGLKDRAGESLDDADVATASANISATRIEFAQLLYDVAREEPAGDVICQYDRLRVYLEPKGRAVGDAPPTLIFNLALPGRVTTAFRCQQ